MIPTQQLPSGRCVPPSTGLQARQAVPARGTVRAAAGNGNGNGNGNGAKLNGSATITDIFGHATVPGPEMNATATLTIPTTEPEPLSPEVQAIIEEQGIDFENSGLKYLSNSGRVRHPHHPFHDLQPPHLLMGVAMQRMLATANAISVLLPCPPHSLSFQAPWEEVCHHML